MGQGTVLTWAQNAVSRKVADRADGPVPSARTDVYVVPVAENPWYEDGVVICWSELNKRLRDTPPFSIPAWPSSSEGKLATSITLRRPWEVCTLNAQSRNLSYFEVNSDDGGNQVFQFVRGTPSHRSVCCDCTKALASVVKQLNDAGLCAALVWSTIVFQADDGEALMRHTGAAFRALRQADLDIDAAMSSFEPRAVTSYGGGLWSTARYGSVAGERLPRLLTDAFFQWLGDRYAWLCEAPIDSPDLVRSEFSRFLEHVARCAGRLGVNVDQLRSAEFAHEAGALLESKRPPDVGPQPWSTLELRALLYLCEVFP